MKISIIIPVHNEEEIIASLVSYLLQNANDNVAEVLVVDSASTDNTIQTATKAGAKVVTSVQQGRAAQLHFGTTIAIGDIFYFVHADTVPPSSYVADIVSAVNSGFSIGRYKTKFDSPSLLLKVNAFFTRFDWFMCMGGDQTLFTTKELYRESGGFDINMQIMEEFEYCKRARKKGRYKIMKGAALISARKYETNSWWQVQKANYTVVKMYKKGATQEAMKLTYKKLLNYR
jgi:rSAM/selenodomain-associated transferase 2